MKVLLFNPPSLNNKKFIREGRCTQEINVWATLWPPISLVLIGAVLHKENHDVYIYDCPAQSIDILELLEIVNKICPDIAIWSTGTPSIDNDLEIADKIKNISNHIKTCIFGTHVTYFSEQIIKQKENIDYIIRNEPEITIKELVNSLNNNQIIKKITGLTGRINLSKHFINPDRSYIDELDKFPFPAWHLINLEPYMLPLVNRKFLIIAPTRGCPYNCSFCTCKMYYGKKLRMRSISNVIDEIENNIEKYDIRDFFIWAETFTINKKYVTDLCNEIIDRGIKIKWTCNSRTDTIDFNILRLMKKAGCWMISFGIESSNQSMLNKAKKNITIEQSKNAVKIAKKTGLKTVGHFLLGLPGETKETIKSTIRFSKNIGLDFAQYYCTVPFPGSNLYKEAIKEKWIQSIDWSFFNQNNFIMKLPSIDSKFVVEMQKKAYFSFYCRINIFFKILFIGRFKGFFKLLKSYLRIKYN